MRRRKFITLIGGAAATWPIAVRVQQAMPVIGFLGSESPELWASRLRAFRQGLGETGFVEGRNVAVEYRWAEGQYNRFPALAAELVHRQVSTIVAAIGAPAALAAKAASATIPIVFFVGVDPVESGLVASLSHPGGNLTGVTNLNQELGPKRLELLHQAVPTASVMALLVNPTNLPLGADSRNVQMAARALGLQLHVLNASNEHEFDSVFTTLLNLRVDALVIGADAFFTSRSGQLAALTVRHAVPAIYQTREFAAAGGLLSYGGIQLQGFQLAGVYAGRILKGEKPADLPVQQSTKVELFINMKTAKVLGLTVPITLLGRADEVIE
jgi:putative tryptophan/tyrosine transport system substrate-binding protein